MTRDPQTNCPSSFDGIDKIFSEEYFLTPGECNPEQRMPLTLLINRLIEVATLHANQIGIGYEFLRQERQTWVLSRVAVEMKRYPGVNDTYRISTWISSISRLFSERDFEITVGDGEIIGHARTVWAVINTDTRQVGDISRMSWVDTLIPLKECPVEKPVRLRFVNPPVPGEEGEYRQTTYRFQYTDLDFNRHVNSSRYIELLLNQWGLDFHDANRLTRFEIAYMHEAHYDMEVTLRMKTLPSSSETHAELLDPDGRPMLRSLLRFSPRHP